MLEMLFENPFIIIILLGIISSLFGKSKDDAPAQQRREQNRPRPQSTQPTKRPHQQPRFELPDIERHLFGEREERRRPQPEVIFEEMSSEVEKQYKVLQQAAKIEQTQMKKSRSEIGDPDRHTGLKQNRKKVVNDDYNSSGKKLPATGNRLIDGIIFAEILGEPRAKNPHTSRRL